MRARLKTAALDWLTAAALWALLYTVVVILMQE
jgi:hypothetical protein